MLSTLPPALVTVIAEFDAEAKQFYGKKQSHQIEENYATLAEGKKIFSGHDIRLVYEFLSENDALLFDKKARLILQQHETELTEAYSRIEHDSPKQLVIVFFWRHSS
jgi:hypothetical protein